MSVNPHLYLLSKTLRPRQAMFLAQSLSQRGGGGGHFERPDPKMIPLYEHTRRVRLEEMNTILYHDNAPEYHMHLHSPVVKNGRQGVTLWLLYFFLFIGPCWAFMTYLQSKSGYELFFGLRPGKDHAYLAPKLIQHLKENNYENKQDALGRRTALFYKNYCRQSMEPEMKPFQIKKLETHGFKL